MNKIFLITTVGCDACNIMQERIEEAIRQHEGVFEFERIDKDLARKHSLLHKLQLHDFPTTLLYKDKDLRFGYVGTRPTIVILRWFDVWFK